MPKETMTPKERWLAVLSRQKPDRLPMDYWATQEATSRLMKHLGCGSVRRMFNMLHIDFIFRARPHYVGPRLPRMTDVFGCKYRNVDYGTGVYRECVHYPLAGFISVAEIEHNYRWPSPDWWDYSSISRQIRSYEKHPIRGGGSEPLLTYKHLRGQEKALVDLIENPDIVHYCLDRLFNLAYEDTLRIIEQIPGKVMIVYVAEDLGGQQDLMISPAHIHEYLMPGMKQMIDLTHQAGAYVFHHNDGNCRRIIPDMVEAGIDLLNPIQWRNTGMDREGLKRDFGDKLVFHGAIDNQYTLPFGTIEEIRREVLENIQILGRDGGYMLAPCHNIQPLTPPENIVALYKTGYEYGWS